MADVERSIGETEKKVADTRQHMKKLEKKI
jgi:hypothetical protein